MKILIHSATLEGEPIPGYGDTLEGHTGLEVVEQMRQQTPFTAYRTCSEYMDDVLAGIGRPSAPPLPEDIAEAANEFLSRLAQYGFITFLPTQSASKLDREVFNEAEGKHFIDREVPWVCADK